MDDDQRIGQLLMREGVLTEDQLGKALEAQKQAFNKPLGEILISMKIIDEADFLRVLAKKFHTQYLTTRKLAELRVPEAVLKVIPQNTAEKYLLFPVQMKRAERTLTVAMANPDDVAALDEVKFVSGMPNIKQLVCLKDSVKAAIDKWYKNEKESFDALLGIAENGGGGYELGGGGGNITEQLENDDSPLDLSAIVQRSDGRDEEKKPVAKAAPAPARKGPKEKDQLDIGGIDIGDDGGGQSGVQENLYLGGMDEMPGDNNLSRDSIVIEEVSGESPMEVEEVMVAPVGPAMTEPDPAEARLDEQKPGRRDVKKYRLRMLVVEPNEAIRKFIVKLFGHEGFKVRGADNRENAIAELEHGEYDSLVIRDRDLGDGEEFASLIAERFPGVELCSIKDYGSAVIGETRAQRKLMGSFLETLDIVMGLYEMEGGGIQGHSHNTAKYTRLIAAKLDLPQRDVDTIALATYLHELGKKGIPHRALIAVDPATVDAESLKEQTEIPLKLLSAAKFPYDIAPTIRHQYERWDGKGLPAGLAGEDIPVGGRVLAVVESFEHLTSKYTGHTPIEPTAALEILKQNEGKLFDPALVEIFLGVVRDDIYLQQMSGTQDRILIADTEVDLLTLLELRLANMGFAVATARTAKETMDKAVSFKPSLILTEADFPDMSGFDMVEKLRANNATKDIPFIFLSRKDDGNSVTRGFRLGAEDYMTKPIKVDIVGAKLNTMMSRLKAEKKSAPASSGVSGSLSEMSLPDIIQILGAGRKTGRITLDDNGRAATIDMIEGQVVNCNIDDLKGEEGFYKILYWEKGSFSIDPTAEITERLITLNNDSLMLEGFRRMDEAGHGDKSEEDITLDGSDFF